MSSGGWRSSRGPPGWTQSSDPILDSCCDPQPLHIISRSENRWDSTDRKAWSRLVLVTYLLVPSWVSSRDLHGGLLPVSFVHKGNPSRCVGQVGQSGGIETSTTVPNSFAAAVPEVTCGLVRLM